MYKKPKKKGEPVWTSTTGLPKWNQSPIDLNQMYVIHQKVSPLYLQGHLTNQGCYKMSNSGNTIKIEFEGERTPILFGGPLPGEYQFSDMQFRWGSADVRGAEHSVEGAWFSMEAQALHWNSSYGSIDKCFEKTDGFACVAFLFQVIGCLGMEDNPNFANITDNLFAVRLPDRSIELPTECLMWMKDVCSEPGYYTYTGSLTTNPFSECVTWIVIPRPIKISARQADQFRQIYNTKGEHILRNYRSLQNIHERKIFFTTDE